MLQFTDKENAKWHAVFLPLAITPSFSADQNKYKRNWKVDKMDTIFKSRVYLLHFSKPVILNCSQSPSESFRFEDETEYEIKLFCVF